MVTVACGLICGCCLMILFNTVFLYEQHLYHLKYERTELVSFNKNNIGMAKIVNYKYNRTNALTNFTAHLKHDVENRVMVLVQAYKFMSNEYRFFPATAEFNFCSYANKDLLGMHRFLECGNLSCPTKAGWQYVCNVALDGNKLPPLIPAGQYKVTLFDGSAELLKVASFGIISYPII